MLPGWFFSRNVSSSYLRTFYWRLESPQRLPHLPEPLASCLAGTYQWAKLWGLCDDFDGYLHQPRALSDSREQNLVGKHQPSRSRHPSVNWSILSLPSRCRQPVKSVYIMVGPLWFGTLTYSIAVYILNDFHSKKIIWIKTQEDFFLWLCSF